MSTIAVKRRFRLICLFSPLRDWLGNCFTLHSWASPPFLLDTSRRKLILQAIEFVLRKRGKGWLYFIGLGVELAEKKKERRALIWKTKYSAPWCSRATVSEAKISPNQSWFIRFCCWRNQSHQRSCITSSHKFPQLLFFFLSFFSSWRRTNKCRRESRRQPSPPPPRHYVYV